MAAPKHQGLHQHRLKKSAGNPEEVKFAQEWARENKFGRTLDYLLCAGDQRFVPEASDRDRLVAATVIQWLGSPVGVNFLKDLGYEKKQ